MVDAVAFDTLATARKLKAAGITEAQAEAAHAGRSELATKADLKAEIAGLEGRLSRAAQTRSYALVGFMIAIAGVAIALTQVLG